MHLPIFDHRREFIDAVNSNQVVVMVGSTGSGKTTRIPIFLLDAGYGQAGIIGITEPRRMPAVEESKFVAALCGVDCGTKVGYQIRHGNNTSRDTRVKYMTEGILIKELSTDPDLCAYSVIMLDEAHESGVNLTLLLGLLKSALSRRPELKLVIASATIDSGRYSRHFGNAPVIVVEGSLYNVEVEYRPLKLGQAYTYQIANIVRQIQYSGDKGDILAFLTGEDDILKTAKMIEDMCLGVVVCPLYSQLSPKEQSKALEQYSRRKVVLATNIAETSVTISGISYVIDSGLIKQSGFRAESGINVLEVVKHSQAGCDQRKGRAGRERDGHCIRLFSEEEFLSRPQFSEPEILRSSVSNVVLFLRGIGIKEVEKYPLIDRPNGSYFRAASEHLTTLGALTSGGKLTESGRWMLDLPVEPHQARQIQAAIKYGCTEAVVTIVAMVSTGKNPFLRPRTDDDLVQFAAEAAKRRFTISGSDHLTLLNLYAVWQKEGGSVLKDDWYEENWVNRAAMESAEKIILQIRSILGKSYKKGSDDRAAIRKSIAAGLVDKVCVGDGSRFTHTFSGESVCLYPGSALMEDVPLIVAEELVASSAQGGKVKARLCTQITAEWLAEIAPLQCDVVDKEWYLPKDSRRRTHEKKKVVLKGVPVGYINRCTAYGGAQSN